MMHAMEYEQEQDKIAHHLETRFPWMKQFRYGVLQQAGKAFINEEALLSLLRVMEKNLHEAILKLKRSRKQNLSRKLATLLHNTICELSVIIDAFNWKFNVLAILISHYINTTLVSTFSRNTPTPEDEAKFIYLFMQRMVGQAPNIFLDIILASDIFLPGIQNLVVGRDLVRLIICEYRAYITTPTLLMKFLSILKLHALQGPTNESEVRKFLPLLRKIPIHEMKFTSNDAVLYRALSVKRIDEIYAGIRPAKSLHESKISLQIPKTVESKSSVTFFIVDTCFFLEDWSSNRKFVVENFLLAKKFRRDKVYPVVEVEEFETQNDEHEERKKEVDVVEEEDIEHEETKDKEIKEEGFEVQIKEEDEKKQGEGEKKSREQERKTEDEEERLELEDKKLGEEEEELGEEEEKVGEEEEKVGEEVEEEKVGEEVEEEKLGEEVEEKVEEEVEEKLGEEVEEKREEVEEEKEGSVEMQFEEQQDSEDESGDEESESGEESEDEAAKHKEKEEAEQTQFVSFSSEEQYGNSEIVDTEYVIVNGFGENVDEKFEIPEQGQQIQAPSEIGETTKTNKNLANYIVGNLPVHIIGLPHVTSREYVFDPNRKIYFDDKERNDEDDDDSDEGSSSDDEVQIIDQVDCSDLEGEDDKGETPDEAEADPEEIKETLDKQRQSEK